jgi:hypothetical protein
MTDGRLAAVLWMASGLLRSGDTARQGAPRLKQPETGAKNPPQGGCGGLGEIEREQRDDVAVRQTAGSVDRAA